MKLNVPSYYFNCLKNYSHLSQLDMHHLTRSITSTQRRNIRRISRHLSREALIYNRRDNREISLNEHNHTFLHAMVCLINF